MAGTKPHAWETGRMNSITYVGLDVHTATVSVAVAESGRGGEIRQLGVFENRPEVLSKVAARLSNMFRGLHQLRSLFGGPRRRCRVLRSRRWGRWHSQHRAGGARRGPARPWLTAMIDLDEDPTPCASASRPSAPTAPRSTAGRARQVASAPPGSSAWAPISSDCSRRGRRLSLTLPRHPLEGIRWPLSA